MSLTSGFGAALKYSRAAVDSVSADSLTSLAELEGDSTRSVSDLLGQIGVVLSDAVDDRA